MSTVKFKAGFKIENGKIYDTKIIAYKLKSTVVNGNIIFYLKESNYKRLNLFEPLLDIFSIEKVFDLLVFNKELQKQRLKSTDLQYNSLAHISNYNTLSKYPPTYLNAKKFYIYKKTRNLLRRLE